MTSVRDDQLPRGAGSAKEVPPRRAASVIVVRGNPVEVLMIRRTETSSFVPSAWVFPGGVVDQIDEEVARETSDGSELATVKIAGVRELFEETGVWIGPPLDAAEQKRRRLLAGSMSIRHLLEESPVDLETLVWTSRWVTPIGVPKRFDTWFFLAAADGVDATAHEEEAVDLAWITPADALSRHEAGDFPMVFPTIKNLEAIDGTLSVEQLLASRRGVSVATVVPRLVTDPDGQKRIVLPG